MIAIDNDHNLFHTLAPPRPPSPPLRSTTATKTAPVVHADSVSERDKQGYYRDKTLDADLWKVLVEKYERYRSEEMLAQCIHEYDTQKNEGMNTCVAKYAPKNKTYCKSISLEARVKVAAGIYMVGYHYYWTEVMKELQMEISPNFEEHLLNLDERKMSKFVREHTKRQKLKRKKREHEKLRKELDRRFKDVAKNMEYGSKIGCNSDEPHPEPKQNKEVISCNHASYGCIAQQKHKTERSKWCTFNGKSKEFIQQVKRTYHEALICRGNYESFAVFAVCFIFWEMLFPSVLRN